MDTGTRKKMGRPKSRGTIVHLHAAISASVMRKFRAHIGPNRILAREVERVLLAEVQRHQP